MPETLANLLISFRCAQTDDINRLCTHDALVLQRLSFLSVIEDILSQHLRTLAQVREAAFLDSVDLFDTKIAHAMRCIVGRSRA